MDTKNEKVTKKKVEGNQLEHHGEHHHHEKMNENHMEHHHVEEKHKEHLHGADDHNHEHHHKHHHHDEHHDHSGHGDFKKLFLYNLPLGLIIMWISPMMGINIPFPFQFTFKYSDIIASVLALIILFFGGKPFFQGAVTEFKQKKPGMMALVSMGIGVSFIYSFYAVIMRYATKNEFMDFYFEFASLLLIMLLGHWIEMVALGKAGDAQKSLAKLLPKEANVIVNDQIFKKEISQLNIGDVVRVQAGENIPADGIVLSGESRVNESLLTGESKPILKKVNDMIIGGSTNGNGSLDIKVVQTGDKSFISQVQQLVRDAQNQPSKAENQASKVAGWLFYIALIASVLAFIVWLVIVDLQTAIIFAVTTLVIACPHALGLAIPLVISKSTSLGATNGLLVKNREAYELTTKANIIVLDKTGTLTTGEFKVLRVDSLNNNYNVKDITALISGLEMGSSHPIAQSIIKYSDEQGIKSKKFTDINILSGKGLEGVYNKEKYTLISQKAFGEDLKINNLPGATISILTLNGKAIGAILLGDELKVTSRELIDILKKKKITPIMATGDNESAASEVAKELGIEYYSNQSPQDKYNLIDKYKKEGKIVVMVGDGVNDAPSLALSDVGIAIGAGTQVAIDSADVVLTQSEPGDIESFIELSFNTNRKMTQNLIWGAGYNFIAIPLAAGILASIGFIITPAIGAILMSLSTVIVAINAMTLRLNK